MNIKDEALKLALTAMDLYDYTDERKVSDAYNVAIDACHQALEQPDQTTRIEELEAELALCKKDLSQLMKSTLTW